MPREKVGSWKSDESSSDEKRSRDVAPRTLRKTENVKASPEEESTERILDRRDYEQVRQKAAAWLNSGGLYAAPGAYAFKMTERETYDEMYTPGLHRAVRVTDESQPNFWPRILERQTPTQRITLLGFAFASIPRLAPQNLAEIPQTDAWREFEVEARTFIDLEPLDQTDKKVAALVAAAALSKFHGAEWKGEKDRRAFAREMWRELRTEAMPRLSSRSGRQWAQVAKVFRSLYDCSPSYFNSEIRKTREWLGFVEMMELEATRRPEATEFLAEDFALALAVVNELAYRQGDE